MSHLSRVVTPVMLIGVGIFVAAGLAPAMQGSFPMIGALISVEVSPPAPSISVGNQQFFGATGHFTGGDRILGGMGSPPQWNIQFEPSFPGLDVTVCTNPPTLTTLCCQGANVAADGTFHASWPSSTPLVAADGFMTPSIFRADLSCHPSPGVSGPLGSIDANWTGTRYQGTFSFANSGTVQITGLQWSSSNPAVAIVDARGVATAVSPGTTMITATYGATCWPGEPFPPGACVGTVVGTAMLTVTGVVCPGPSLDRLTASPAVLWPPNHKMVEVDLTTEVSNPCGRPFSCQIVSVSSNEPAEGLGDGNTRPDWEIIGPLSVKLRAERSGGGGGRAYTILVSCTDGSGNISTKAVVVTVPHNR